MNKEIKEKLYFPKNFTATIHCNRILTLENSLLYEADYGEAGGIMC